MALHVLDEANRCLGCKKPMCQQGCPIHTNIPEVIRLLKDNHLDDAGRMLFENNPLTTVCSLVCNHENQCEGHCIRNRMPSHDPVHFSIIEDYISTTYANKMTSGPAPRNGMKAAVVGSGPAGLTVAVLLARWGYDVTIFDARDKIGGVMRYGIPNYRLPDSVLDDFQYRHLELKGIHVRPNTAIGKTITIDDLFRDGYKSVFIGAGLWKANAMHIKGETLGNAAFGIDYLANSKAFQLGDDIAVIGVGNSAMDCARTAIRNGARHVTCYARRDEECISASEHEVRYAKLEGVGFRFCKAPVEIRENGIEVKNTFLTIKAKPTLATDKPAEIGGPVDYLFCCTKSYDLDENIAQLAPIIGPDTVIIPLLNGADITERIQKLLPDNEVWKGCVYIGSRLVRPGRIEKFTIKDRVFLGNNKKDKTRLKELQEILANARILTTVPDDIDLEIWKKFFMISTAATATSYFNETISEVLDRHIDLYITLSYELKSVAEAKGIRFKDNPVFSSIEAQKIMPNNSTTSMHSDFKRGSRTEVETLTGYVVRTAEELGVEVPTYQFMYKGLTQFPYPVD